MALTMANAQSHTPHPLSTAIHVLGWLVAPWATPTSIGRDGVGLAESASEQQTTRPFMNALMKGCLCAWILYVCLI